MSLNSNTQDLNEILDTMNNLPLGGGGLRQIGQMIDESGVLDGTEGTVTEKVEQVIDKAEYGNIWYEHSGVMTDYDSLFANSTEKKLPALKFSSCTSIRYFISNSAIEEIDYYIDAPKLKPTVCYFFHSAKNLKRIVGINTSRQTSAYGLCYNCLSLETIQEPFDFTNVIETSAAFSGASKLKDIRFVKETIKVSITISSGVLTAESIQSIIDGLAYVETAQTLTLHKNIVLTDEQKATINSKGWTLVQ